MEKALGGVKIIELGNFISAPYCTKLMADLGAEVIKVEEPFKGDESRHHGPFPGDIPHPEKSGLFLYLNTNKLGITLNLKTATGRKILRQLLKDADILVENNPPQLIKELSLDYPSLKEINPRLIMTSITPFGQTGPYKDYKAYYLNIFHAGGEGYCLPGGTGWLQYPYREPIKAGGFIGEYDIGLSAAIATLGVLCLQRTDDKGQHIDISGQEALLGLMRTSLWRYNEGFIESRATRFFPVAGLMQCGDGFVQVMPLEPHMWNSLLAMMGNPKWAEEEKYKFARVAKALDPREQAPLEDREAVNALIEVWMLEHNKEEILKMGQEKGCPIGMVCTSEDLFNSNQLRVREFFQEIEHPKTGRCKYPTAPYKFSRTPWKAERAAPLLGEHNEAIFCERLGYGKDELAMLRQSGII